MIIFRCSDYLLIDRGAFGTTEICGNGTFEYSPIASSSIWNLYPQSFRILFRTSEEARGKGFQMLFICFKDEPMEGENLSLL